MMRRNGPRIMLAFSRGKDAIGAWLALRADGFEVIPIHYETIPGMQFIADSLRYYEDFFGTEIISVPHPSFFKCIDSGLFQPPSRLLELNALDLHREIDYRDIYDDVYRLRGCGEWYCTGVRASDSMIRRMSLATHGSIIESEKKAHVIWDWTAEQLRAEIRKVGVKLPIDYKLFGRSFDGVGIEYMHALREWFPADYALALRYFPLIEMELFRDEVMRHERH
jgi:hypothetical protein